MVVPIKHLGSTTSALAGTSHSFLPEDIEKLQDQPGAGTGLAYLNFYDDGKLYQAAIAIDIHGNNLDASHALAAKPCPPFCSPK